MAKTRDMSEAAAEAPARSSAVWDALAKALFDPYRPEQHYMRGPGPRWHEKHDHAQPDHAQPDHAQPNHAQPMGPGAARDHRAAH